MRTEQTLLDRGAPEVLRGALVTDEYFAVFGVRAAVGRVLNVGDPVGEGSPIVMSYRLWQRRFGRDAGVIGRAVRLSGGSHTIVGVMPANFRYPDDADYWTPYRSDATELARVGTGPFTAVARLKNADVTTASSQARVLDMSPPAGRDAESKVTFVPLIESMAGVFRSNLTLLLGAVTMVLLIACLNVANLLLAHATAREQELAVRGAIGATRWRLLRQLVAESLILAAAGAGAGLALAQLIVMSLPSLGTLDIPRIDEVTLDWRVLTFAMAAAGASVCIFGIGPPWLSIRRVAPALGSGRSVAGPRKRTTSHALIAVQLAATLALLVGSALVLTSLYRQHTVDFGFDTSDVTMTTIRPSSATLKRLGGIAFNERLLDRLRDDPELESVAAMSHVPLEPALAARATVTTAQGLVVGEGRDGPRLRVLSPGTFQTLGVPIVRGRDFSRTDRDGSPLVTIVNEMLAHKLWGTREPLGESIVVQSSGTKRSYVVVGIARDFRPSIRRVSQPEVYVTSAQEASRLKIVVRSRLNADMVAARIRGAILSEDPEAAIAGVSTVGRLIWDGTAYTRFHAALVTIFGAFAALLASSGILAVVLYTIARRTREMGIRIAIGAAPQQVVMLLMREMTFPIVVGLAGGLLTIYSLANLLHRQVVLFEVRQFDPALYAVTTVALTILALVAAWLPARRAGRVDPMVALRAE
jgi:putative ABC transport system permease protein